MSAAYSPEQPSVLLGNRTVLDARVVDGMAPVTGAGVWVRGDRIAAVGPYAEVAEQARAAGRLTEVDLDGAFLTPGLVNMHTHFSLSLPGSAPGRQRQGWARTTSPTTWPTGRGARCTPA
ncbi:hypothetical protein V2I01_26670 [Micromonospora sp. BRA006-A]|nr:hypothetical protein [Micromonospora sp. BRA006-A]